MAFTVCTTNGTASTIPMGKNCSEEQMGGIDLNSVLHLIISRAGVNEKTRIKDATKVERLINELISSGTKSLQVITDFDATLSCYKYDGKLCSTSYGIISDSRLTPEDVRVRSEQLFQHYHPIEIDPSISEEEKSRKMVEWYDMKHANYLNSSVKIKSSDIPEVIKEAHIFLRDGSVTLMGKLQEENIPCLVFSAGNGNTIVEVLKSNSVLFPNMKVIGNFMEFDKNTQELVRFSQPVIHTVNKNEAAMHGNHSDYFESLKTRTNVILMGDTIGDAHMAHGVADLNTILKIGYLNFKFEERLDSFLEHYDIVLVDDQSMHFVNALIDLITKAQT